MAAPTSWLIDTSAAVRLAGASEPEVWADRVRRGLVRVCAPTRLELGWAARSGEQLRQVREAEPWVDMPVEHLTPSVERRAEEVQVLLADRGQHRGPSPVDLLVAAVAERTRLVVLHVDRDYELIADITGQPVERLVLADAG